MRLSLCKLPKRLPVASQRALIVLAALILAGVSTARIVSTYHVFSQTYDEPSTVAAGMEWLDRATYTIDNTQPPLARLPAALGLFFDGQHVSDLPAADARTNPLIFAQQNWAQSGNKILYARGQYSHNLALARVGELPFFFLATAVVWVWARKVFGESSALVSVLLFTTLPPVLAHAGLATTDMAIAATSAFALLVFIYWLESPTYVRSCALGLAVALAILSKFSALLFLPSSGLAILACRWMTTRDTTRGQPPKMPWRRKVGIVAAIVVTTFVVIWGGYRFSVHITRKADRPHEKLDSRLGSKGFLHDVAYVIAEHVPVPAPELVEGIRTQQLHNARGQLEYLFGQVSRSGWWYFFLVVLAVKTPLPFLILCGVGLAVIATRGKQGVDWRAMAPAAAAATLLVVSMVSKIDLGVRLILPIYPLLAIVAGMGAVSLWHAARTRRAGAAIVLVLLFWQVLSSVRAHPDYLAYFNEFGGSRPERIVVDSDLDWGQDLLRLATELRDRKIDSVTISYFGSADLSQHDLPRFQRLLSYQKATGWIAISKSALKYGEGAPPYRGYAWLESYKPEVLVGRSILLYYIPGTPEDVRSANLANERTY